uniref:RNA-directed DNA polymerase n=1 Tax=Romanomermis culicivorax TaxID=13658 RepID=A0A915L6T9_ROMCU
MELKSKDKIWESQTVDATPRFTQIYPEDSQGEPESILPANLVNAVTTRSMAREVEKNNQAQVQPYGNQGQVKKKEGKHEKGEERRVTWLYLEKEPEFSLADPKENELPKGLIRDDLMALLERKDDILKAYFDRLGQNGTIKYHSGFYILKKVLYWEARQGADNQVVVPSCLRGNTLHQYHGAIMMTQQRFKRTLVMIIKRFWWPGIEKYVRQWIKFCPVCQMANPGNAEVPTLIPIIPEEPFNIVSVNIADRPLCICVVCTMHDSGKSQKTQENSDAKWTDMPPALMADIEMAEQKIDSHQLAVDKLTFALNTIEIENEQENDPTIKEKLNKYASLLKTQLADIITNRAVYSLMDVKMAQQLSNLRILPTSARPIAANGDMVSDRGSNFTLV